MALTCCSRELLVATQSTSNDTADCSISFAVACTLLVSWSSLIFFTFTIVSYAPMTVCTCAFCCEGHIYRFVLSVKERCDAEDAADKAGGGAAGAGGDVELQQSIIAAKNDRTQQLRAAAAVVKDIDRISTFFADVVWPLLLKFVALVSVCTACLAFVVRSIVSHGEMIGPHWLLGTGTSSPWRRGTSATKQRDSCDLPRHGIIVTVTCSQMHSMIRLAILSTGLAQADCLSHAYVCLNNVAHLRLESCSLVKSHPQPFPKLPCLLLVLPTPQPPRSARRPPLLAKGRTHCFPRSRFQSFHDCLHRGAAESAEFDGLRQHGSA